MRVSRLPLYFLILVVLLCGCAGKTSQDTLSKFADTTISVYGPYKVIKLPVISGVKISNPIQIKLGPANVLYAANQTGEVYSLKDTDNDGLEDTGVLYCDVKDYGLRSPSSITFSGDTIFIGTAQQIRAFKDVDHDGDADTSWVVFDEIPNSEHPYEWTCGLSFGPDGALYFALSTDSWNAAPSPDPKGYRGSILKLQPGGKAEAIATGIRSVYGLSFNADGQLFFIDNEGGGNPKEELNLLETNSFYGHNPEKYKFDSARGPVHALETEMAPSGIEFNRKDNNFGGTAGDLFVAFYGPGERWARGGVGRVHIEPAPDGTVSYKEFPIADIPKLSNLAFGGDGSLYVSQHGRADYWYNPVYENEGCFYKIVYDASLAEKPVKQRRQLVEKASGNSVEAGKQLFAESACLACHAVDGSKELLGPNLQDIGKRLSRDEILEEILEPSKRIKPSMGGVRVTKKDGQVLIGRIVNSNENEISMIMVGNHVVKIKRGEVARTEDEKQSLMYTGLLTNLSNEQRESLLDYIVSLSTATP